jgi:hypothetical protein
LWQLIQFADGKDAADPCQAVVAFQGERTSPIVAIPLEFAKLVHAEGPAVLSKPELREQDRAAAFDPYCCDDEQHNGCEHGNRNRSAANINCTPHPTLDGTT